MNQQTLKPNSARNRAHRFNKKLRVWKVACAILIAALIGCGIMVIRYHNEAEEKVATMQMYYLCSSPMYEEMRNKEYNIFIMRSNVMSNQGQLESNIDLAYTLIKAKSEQTDDDALIRVIEERISHVRETMSAADLVQAISILKENFPNESFLELDEILAKNNDLLDLIVKQKEKYNDLVRQYNESYELYKPNLDAIGYTQYQFELYELGEG